MSYSTSPSPMAAVFTSMSQEIWLNLVENPDFLLVSLARATTRLGVVTKIFGRALNSAPPAINLHSLLQCIICTVPLLQRINRP